MSSSASVHSLFPEALQHGARAEADLTPAKPVHEPEPIAAAMAQLAADDEHASRVVAAKAEAIAERARLRREWMRGILLTVLPPVLGIALFIGAWAAFSQATGSLPSPANSKMLLGRCSTTMRNTFRN